MMNTNKAPYSLKAGDAVTGSYYGQVIAGRVAEARLHSMRSDLMLITVALDTPVVVFGEARPSVQVACDVSTGAAVKGWGDCHLS